MQGDFGVQPVPYSGSPQFIHPISPGFNGAPKPTHYNRNAAVGLGITQMIIGIICLIMNSILIAYPIYWLPYAGYGIWGGVLIFVAGLLQVLSAKKVESRCLIIGTMVMTIIAACACSVIFGFSVAETVYGDNKRSYNNYLYNSYNSYNYYNKYYYNNYNNNYLYNSYYNYYENILALTLGSIMAILAFVEAVIAITTSAICCGAVCCKSSSRPSIPVYVVGNQPMTFQASYPRIVLPPGQTPIAGGTSSQMSFNPYPYPQVPTSSEMDSNPPPTYNNSDFMETKANDFSGISDADT